MKKFFGFSTVARSHPKAVWRGWSWRFSILIFCLSLLPQCIFAQDSEFKYWQAIHVQGSLCDHWLYLFRLEGRFFDKHPYWQNGLIDIGTGFQFAQNLNLMGGFRYFDHHPPNSDYKTNQFWQHLHWHPVDTTLWRLSSRSRMEEFHRTNQKHWAVRLRQQLIFEMNKYYFGKLNPVFYDEMFFQFNKTNFTSHSFISQNRLFLGFYYYFLKPHFIEFGYMAQYLANTPIRPDNRLDHVIILTLHFRP